MTEHYDPPTEAEYKELVQRAKYVWKSKGAKKAVIDDKVQYVAMRLSGFVLAGGKQASSISYTDRYNAAQEARLDL